MGNRLTEFRRLLFLSIGLLSGFLFHSNTYGQQLSPQTRARFVKEQDQYLQQLALSEKQKRGYQTLTIEYEKEFMTIYRSKITPAAKKKRVKQEQKRKNQEMSNLLTRSQYQRYIKRQKEIAKNYYD